MKQAEIRPQYIEDLVERAVRKKLGLPSVEEDAAKIAAIEAQRIAAESIVRQPYPSASAETRAAIDGFLKRASRGDSSVYNDADFCHLTSWKLNLDDAATLHRDIAARLAASGE